jgi:hypothetical protein
MITGGIELKKKISFARRPAPHLSSEGFLTGVDNLVRDSLPHESAVFERDEPGEGNHFSIVPQKASRPLIFPHPVGKTDNLQLLIHRIRADVPRFAKAASNVLIKEASDVDETRAVPWLSPQTGEHRGSNALP